MKMCRAVMRVGLMPVLLLSLVGCTMVSPILLQLPSEDAGTGKVPLKVGVVDAQKPGEQKLSHINTCSMLGIYQFRGRMPRRSEVDYVGMAMADYLRDRKVFSYIYNDPFDRSDVDLILKTRLADFHIKNNTAFSTGLQHVGLIPMVGLASSLWLLAGLPQEFFSIQQTVEFVVETPTGQPVARYAFQAGDSDGVNMYEQPFGNYMWYDSVFQQQFFDLMGQLESALVKDRMKLMQAVKR